MVCFGDWGVPSVGVRVRVYSVQRLGEKKVKVGEREIKMREMLGRSCGCYDIGYKNFKLLTTSHV